MLRVHQVQVVRYAAHKLVTVGAPLSDGLPLMPAPDMAGDPTKRPISTREVSGWIKLLLNRRCIDVGERSVSSHRAKATTLSYLAKHEQT